MAQLLRSTSPLGSGKHRIVDNIVAFEDEEQAIVTTTIVESAMPSWGTCIDRVKLIGAKVDSLFIF
jgi:hypothetical protein